MALLVITVPPLRLDAFPIRNAHTTTIINPAPTLSLSFSYSFSLFPFPKRLRKGRKEKEEKDKDNELDDSGCV